MPLEIIVVPIFILPVVAFFTALVWYLNPGGARSVLRKPGRRSGSRPGAEEA